MTSTQMQTQKADLMAFRAAMADGPVPTMEQARAGMDARFGDLPPIDGASYEAVDAGGAEAEWVRPDQPTTGTMLYLHGGAFVVGSIRSHRRLLTSLCLAAGTQGLNVGYRLAPENPFPAGLQDALAAYRWLIGPGGERPENVVIAGDSAGGGLALATLLALRDEGDPLPGAALLLSPWTDLTMSGESIRTREADDPVLTPDGLRARVPLYLPDGDPRHPLVSTLFADLQGLPPTLVQVGEAEIIYDDSTRLVDKAREAGVAVEIETWPEAYHVFQLMVGTLPEADDAVAKAGAWIARQLTGSTTGGHA